MSDLFKRLMVGLALAVMAPGVLAIWCGIGLGLAIWIPIYAVFGHRKPIWNAAAKGLQDELSRRRQQRQDAGRGDLPDPRPDGGTSP